DKAVKPASVVGASKRLAEWYVQSVAAKMNKQQDIRILITRFGNVLGSNGSVITRFRKQIEDGGPVTVAHPDMTRYFMTIPEATRLVLEAASFGENGGVYVFEMGQPIRIAELARKMIELAGYTPDKDIAITYCGMQPGEKMVEQQTSDGEEPLSTEHDYIKTTHFVHHQYEEVATMVDQVVALSETVQIEAVITLLKQLIPDFKPSSTHKRLVNV
ncbi:MAG TPA: polysaccharide biosynthesis protein, partial [Bacteroidales bacterium]|nr:polysaccharide biosynthesis protein [Bacteroidales bacterium]